MPTNTDITFFAKTNFRNREVPFGIRADDRRRHMYVMGKTGMGKTTLMENMVIQDIRNGKGVCFIDPHGDSVVKILDFIPNSRINDVVYFNPADMEFPIAFNILESVDLKYKHLVASGLMGVFTKIWANMWSARMEYILNNTILALLDSPGNTMLGIVRMYVDKKYRKKIIDNIKDPMVRSFWVDEWANYAEKFRTEAVAPIQNKVGQFLSSSIIRNIVGQPRSTIDLRDIMDNKKILLLDLSKGKVGEDNSALLGAMIITKLQLAALSRVDIPEEQREDFYLYVDEFQNFVTDSFATILSEARKYRLNLIIGHQYMGQLMPDKNNTKVRDAVFGNVGTMIIFRVGSADAEYLETEFDPIFTPNDIVNLPKAHIILKLMINGVASEPFSAVTLPPISDGFSGNAEKVIKVSRERHANPAADVEEKISRWMGAEFHEQSAESANQESIPTTVSTPTNTPNRASASSTASASAPRSANAYAPPIRRVESSPGRRYTDTAPKPAPLPKQPEPKITIAASAVASLKTPTHSPKPPAHHPSKTTNTDHKPRASKPPTKSDNPIWHQANEMDSQKSNVLTENLVAAIDSAFSDKPIVQAVNNNNQKTVVQPGEVHKF